MVEASVNVKVLQETLGHKDISTTMNIYADVSKEFQKKEFEGAEKFFVDKPALEPDTPDRAKIIRIVFVDAKKFGLNRDFAFSDLASGSAKSESVQTTTK